MLLRLQEENEENALTIALLCQLHIMHRMLMNNGEGERKKRIRNLMYEYTTWKWGGNTWFSDIFDILSGFPLCEFLSCNFSTRFFSSLQKGSNEKKNLEQVVKEFRRSNRETFLPYFDVKFFWVFFFFIFFPSDGERKWRKNAFSSLILSVSVRFFCLLGMKYLLVIRRWNENVCFCLT
jgi:hypothetical protein